MSGTFKILLVMVAFIGSPSDAFGFDFEAEIAKQNRVYTDVAPCRGRAQYRKCYKKSTKKHKAIKVLLVSAK